MIGVFDEFDGTRFLGSFMLMICNFSPKSFTLQEGMCFLSVMVCYWFFYGFGTIFLRNLGDQLATKA
jgi:hypothetical protein